MSFSFAPLCAPLRRLLWLSALVWLAACTTYTEDGELVQHQFGYVRIITPKSVSNGAPIEAMEVTTFGLWVKADSREGDLKEAAGLGLGATYARRERIPLSCNLVIRLRADENFDETVKTINEILGGQNPCIIEESNVPLAQQP